jgi:hypothetical protein
MDLGGGEVPLLGLLDSRKPDALARRARDEPGLDGCDEDPAEDLISLADRCRGISGCVEISDPLLDGNGLHLDQAEVSKGGQDEAPEGFIGGEMEHPVEGNFVAVQHSGEQALDTDDQPVRRGSAARRQHKVAWCKCQANACGTSCVRLRFVHRFIGDVPSTTHTASGLGSGCVVT